MSSTEDGTERINLRCTPSGDLFVNDQLIRPEFPPQPPGINATPPVPHTPGPHPNWGPLHAGSPHDPSWQQPAGINPAHTNLNGPWFPSQGLPPPQTQIQDKTQDQMGHQSQLHTPGQEQTFQVHSQIQSQTMQQHHQGLSPSKGSAIHKAVMDQLGHHTLDRKSVV